MLITFNRQNPLSCDQNSQVFHFKTLYMVSGAEKIINSQFILISEFYNVIGYIYMYNCFMVGQISDADTAVTQHQLG